MAKVLVTGANKGIGYGICKYLGLSGWQVIVGARDKERAEAKLNKDYAKADQIREDLKAHNFSILDTNQTSFWQYLETPML